VAKLGSYLYEHMAAKRYLQWIESECADVPASQIKAAA
jgi:hypothetical protein